MKKVKFKTNINCEGCLRTVTPFLNRLEDVERWQVDISDPDKVLTVEFDGTDSREVVDAVTSAGFSIDEIPN